MGVVKDVSQIVRIVAAVVALFNLNSFQKNELENYVKLQQYEWIAKRKDDAEVEGMLKSEARRICGR